MSIHASKGLDFPIVFIIGVEEDLFPHFSVSSDGALEEERRLFYVALTRAMERVFITSNLERGGFGKIYKIQESRFIKEIPEEYLKRI
jgi:DNA helicase-2/ATP-dependent DNA helicase PcrA